jgi:mannosylglycoprotein endo-beta-mannosidase
MLICENQILLSNFLSGSLTSESLNLIFRPSLPIMIRKPTFFLLIPGLLTVMFKRIFAALPILVALLDLPACTTQPNALVSEHPVQTTQPVSLDSGWVCLNIKDVHTTGEELSRPTQVLSGWLPATVPGTVLTTLLNNGKVPDPFYGMNARKIPDIYNAGREEYTYWFAKDFRWHTPTNGSQVWLRFRGVNYGFDAYLNGHRVNRTTEYGMFLRHTYNITSLLAASGENRLALLVYPPDPVGNPNGGQGGDGTIAHNICNQYVVGWDWIQPIADRNTGIWDKVTVEETGRVSLTDPNIISLVPGKRFPGRTQSPAILRASAELANPTGESVKGTFVFQVDNKTIAKEVRIPPDSTIEVHLPDFMLANPRLWWPNGYGPQNLYQADFKFVGTDGNVMDETRIGLGIREIQTHWNSHTQSREVLVNGQPIFIKGGNWITSDAMLRLSPKRYDAEVRFHRDMNLNLIRIWGGGITERPEFYDACDKYGLLVFQDLWISGDCNGKWLDPMKKEDQWTRRKYPDDHDLFLRSVADQVKMLRHHPSLAFYCGGNEMPPARDLLLAIQDSLLPALDSSRFFFAYSNVDSMSYNATGGNGDGPYYIQEPKSLWENRFFSFNSEIGSVGMGDFESLERFIPAENLTTIPAWRNVDSVWRYHKYSGYGRYIDVYGTQKSVGEFTEKAQLVNFDQYRALMEGHLSHMWGWYTGLIIWKTQNPWTAIRGQMYDYYLDPNASLYGLHHANEPLHVMLSPIDSMIYVVNNTFEPCHDLMVQGRTVDFTGRDSLVFQWFVELSPSCVQKIQTVRRQLATILGAAGGFFDLRLLNTSQELLSENLYWFPDTTGHYSGLQRMDEAKVATIAKQVRDGRIEVRIDNPAGNPLAFFQRLSLIDRTTKKRLLPVFYSDNYVSVLPGQSRLVSLEFPADLDIRNAAVAMRGWNVPERYIEIQAEGAPTSR